MYDTVNVSTRCPEAVQQPCRTSDDDHGIFLSCIKRGIFDVNDVNDILYALDEKTLR